MNECEKRKLQGALGIISGRIREPNWETQELNVYYGMSYSNMLKIAEEHLVDIITKMLEKKDEK